MLANYFIKSPPKCTAHKNYRQPLQPLPRYSGLTGTCTTIPVVHKMSFHYMVFKHSKREKTRVY